MRISAWHKAQGDEVVWWWSDFEHYDIVYMSKIFSRITGRPLMAYISDRRMEKAKELLLATELPVSRVAMEVGFTNFSYFSKMFRTYTGSTPNEYRSRKKRI